MSDKKVDDIDELTKKRTAFDKAFMDDMYGINLDDAVREEKVINVDIPKIETKRN